MSKIAIKKVMAQVLLEESAKDKDVVVLCSDSRGSGGLTDYAKERPAQFIEVGIAEQNLVSMSAGLAACGKKPFAVSPASFLSTRSMEQVKVDVAYSRTNVKLIGISGGVSYGALGMTHHSPNDIATMASLPNMRVYLPSDGVQAAKLFRALVHDNEAAYIRIGRNAVPDIYEEDAAFELGKASVVAEGNDVTLIACGEMVAAAKEAAEILKDKGVSARVLDMYCVKPLDKEAVIKAAKETKAIVTIEEHTLFGGMGSMVSQLVAAECPKCVVNMGLPDSPVVTGKSQEVFDHYGLNAEGIVKKVLELI